MNRQAVTSSAIRAVGFENDVIEFEMPNGTLYQYSATQEEFDKTLAAESVGKHFHANFRGRPFLKIVPQKVEAV